ncbi:hypothetical protein HY68_15350 [Streptomyces sp. AcH 505]|uniref:hypothetical protein n=1 Tax=Streptomyces sp. AcH 505 TaxID=352211 RepID=UPI00059200E7|nr:hypothetical protein HY68_15350 [Streptomyces sp. AcH 505]
MTKKTRIRVARVAAGAVIAAGASLTAAGAASAAGLVDLGASAKVGATTVQLGAGGALADEDPSGDPTDPGDGDETTIPDPTDDPTDPGDPTDEPTTPGDPTDEPTNPGDPTDEPTNPGDPTDEPTNPGTPTDEPTKPGTPTDEPTKPSTSPTQGAGTGGGGNSADPGTCTVSLDGVECADNTDTDSVGSKPVQQGAAKDELAETGAGETSFLLIGAAVMIAGGVGFRFLPRMNRGGGTAA